MPKVGVQTAVGVAIAVIIALGIGLGVTYIPSGTGTTSSSHVKTTTSSTYTSSSSYTTLSSCNTTIDISGTKYCTLEVTNDIVLGNPGYSVFNASNGISFNGVIFTTLCPSGYSGCPNTLGNDTTLTLLAGVIKMNLAFQDGTNETVGNILNIGGNLTILSNHVNPRAGVFIEFRPAPSFPNYRTFLLVQESSVPCPTPISSNMTIYAVKNLNLTLCVRFYYYSSGAPLNVTSADQLSIGAVSNGSGILTSPPSNALSNFTVTAQPTNFLIGGPSNENEGILVEYTIHPLANGSYILNLGLLAPQIQKCWAEFELVVGNGIPNYYPYGTTCQILSEISTTITTPYPAGALFAEVVGYYVALRA